MLEAGIVLASLGVALALVADCASRSNTRPSLPVGPPNWDFTKSWATNITIVGALFGSFFSNSVVTSPRYVPSPGYVVLSILFALLTLVAPLVFVALSKAKQVPRGASSDLEHQGNAIAFLLAMLFTLWGALGQIGTLGLLGFEVLASGKAASATTIFLVILLLAAVTTVVYAHGTAIALLKHRTAHHRNRRIGEVEIEALRDVPEEDRADSSLLTWPLL